ncbi:hypothetical protein HK405_008316 [Cladochytrium tenue]|nr:hypothetical protein HK405_008316 [Cladochytrium tenue]
MFRRVVFEHVWPAPAPADELVCGGPDGANRTQYLYVDLVSCPRLPYPWLVVAHVAEDSAAVAVQLVEFNGLVAASSAGRGSGTAGPAPRHASFAVRGVRNQGGLNTAEMVPEDAAVVRAHEAAKAAVKERRAALQAAAREVMEEPAWPLQDEPPPAAALPDHLAEACGMRMARVVEEVTETEEKREAKFELVRKIQSILTTEFPDIDIRVHLFGSSSNGLSLATSDVDLVLDLPPELLYPPSTSSGSIASTPLPPPSGPPRHPAQNIYLLARHLSDHGMKPVSAIPAAKVPLCRFRDPELGLSADLAVGHNLIGIENSRLLATYAGLRCYGGSGGRMAVVSVRALLLLVKAWAKRAGLADPGRGLLSSYAWSLLLLAHLQRAGRLPSLQALARRRPARAYMLARDERRGPAASAEPSEGATADAAAAAAVVAAVAQVSMRVRRREEMVRMKLDAAASVAAPGVVEGGSSQDPIQSVDRVRESGGSDGGGGVERHKFGEPPARPPDGMRAWDVTFAEAGSSELAAWEEEKAKEAAGASGGGGESVGAAEATLLAQLFYGFLRDVGWASGGGAGPIVSVRAGRCIGRMGEGVDIAVPAPPAAEGGIDLLVVEDPFQLDRNVALMLTPATFRTLLSRVRAAALAMAHGEAEGVL